MPGPLPAAVSPPPRGPFGPWRLRLVWNVAAPYVVFRWLTERGWSTVLALSLSGLFPIGTVLVTWVRTRRLDLLGLGSLLFILSSVVVGLLTDNAQVLLLRGSLLTGGLGLVCLASLGWPRPALFYVGRYFVSGGDATREARFTARWQDPAFRAMNRRLTLVWGVAYLAEASLRVALSFALPLSVFLLVSPALGLGTTAGLIGWTRWNVDRARRDRAPDSGA